MLKKFVTSDLNCTVAMMLELVKSIGFSSKKLAYTC